MRRRRSTSSHRRTSNFFRLKAEVSAVPAPPDCQVQRRAPQRVAEAAVGLAGRGRTQTSSARFDRVSVSVRKPSSLDPVLPKRHVCLPSTS
jgi:hypothetical protein